MGRPSYPYSNPCISIRHVHISVKGCCGETGRFYDDCRMIKVVFNSSSPLPFFLFPSLLWWFWGSNSSQGNMCTWQIFCHWLTCLAPALCPSSIISYFKYLYVVEIDECIYSLCYANNPLWYLGKDSLTLTWSESHYCFVFCLNKCILYKFRLL